MSIQPKMALWGIAASCVMLASTALYAGPAPSDQTATPVVVHFADLNLNQPSDVAVLYQRISVAATRVCGPSAITGDYYVSPAYRSCYFKAIAQAVASVNNPSVTAYYMARVGHTATRATSLAAG
jgi:UrcA family protein